MKKYGGTYTEWRELGHSHDYIECRLFHAHSYKTMGAITYNVLISECNHNYHRKRIGYKCRWCGHHIRVREYTTYLEDKIELLQRAE